MGGGAIRTAAKAAAFAGARRSHHPPMTPSAASTVHVAASGDQQSVTLLASNEKVYPAGTQWPALDLDDWEFAGGMEDEAVFGSDLMDPPPRIVFGSAPTLEEAKEATSDLKDALEKVYFSSPASEASPEVSKISESIVSTTTNPSIPKHVAQTFSLLHGSSEAQNVVASLASDKNVWDAIMKNEKVMDFYKNHKTATIGGAYLEEVESTGSVDSPLEESSEMASAFSDFVDTVKLKVSNMVNTISDFIQDFLGTSSDSNSQADTANSKSGYVDLGLGASFMALAVATILVVLVKRG